MTKPALEVETWAISRLRPYERNARKHPPEQVQQLRAAFRDYGQVHPILVRDDGTIICGHGRVEAATLEKFTTMRVIVARGWTAAQCRAFALLDNKIALNAKWDDAMLTLELGDLRSLDEIDIGIMGFSPAELKRILSDPVDPQDTSPKLGGLSYAVVVRCTDEQTQMELLAKLEAEGLTCEALIS